MKTSKAQKTTTVSVGDGPPRVVPLDKEDEYASGEAPYSASMTIFFYLHYILSLVYLILHNC